MSTPVEPQTTLLPEAGVRAGSGAMFDRIAGRYDLLNRLMSLGLDQRWRRKLVDEVARDAPRGPLLDLATGTADVAIMAAQRLPERTVLGVDPSAEMLARGRTKVEAAGLSSRLSLHEGDAQALSTVADHSVAMVTMSFGIRNVPDRARALREMVRVLMPSGRVGILELGEPRDGPLSVLSRFHVHTIVPTLGAVLSRDAEYKYLARSIAAFPAPEVFAQLMRDAGFVDVTTTPLSFGALHLYAGTAPH